MAVDENFWNAVKGTQDPQKVLFYAERYGLSAEDVADTFKAKGGQEFANVDANFVKSWMQSNPIPGYSVGNDGRINFERPGSQPQPDPQPDPQPNPQPQPDPTGEDREGDPRYESNDGNPRGNQNTDTDWANIEQYNADWRTSVQGGVFNNPNIYLPDGSQQTVSFGELPDYSAYVRDNPDLLANFNAPENPFKSMEAFGKWHWENNGQAEGRELPTGSAEDLGFLQPDVRVQLSPQEQAIYDADQRSRASRAAMGENQLGRINDSFGSPTIQDRGELYDPTQFMTGEGLFDFTIDPTVGGFNQVRDDLIERESDRFDRARSQTENDLLVRGLNPGTEAWNARMDDLNRAENDFSLGATQFAGQEQGRLFDMQGRRRQQDVGEQELAYNVARDWRGNQIKEDAYFRNQPLNEYNALMTGTQIGQPDFMGYQGSLFQGPNYAGAEQENWNRQYMNNQLGLQKRGQTLQALGDIAGAAGTYFGMKG